MKNKTNPLRYDLKFYTEESFALSLQTERLSIHSLRSSDKEDYLKLFQDPVAMAKYATGDPYGEEKAQRIFQKRLATWERQDPFSIYTLIEKKTAAFMGFIGIEAAGKRKAEVFYAIRPEFWGQGYGREAIHAVFELLLPRLMLRGYQATALPLKKFVATARLDNPASQKMLTGVGFKEEKIVHKYGNWRISFGLFAKDLRHNYHQFFERRNAKTDAVSVSDDPSLDLLLQSDFAKKFRASR